MTAESDVSPPSPLAPLAPLNVPLSPSAGNVAKLSQLTKPTPSTPSSLLLAPLSVSSPSSQLPAVPGRIRSGGPRSARSNNAPASATSSACSRWTAESSSGLRPVSAAEQNHLARLRAAREADLALLRAGGYAAARALAEKARPHIVARVDQQARRERERRSHQIAVAYSTQAAISPATAHRSATAAAAPPGSLAGPSSAAAGGRSHGGRPGASLELTRTILGEGATSKVWLGRFGPTRCEVAAKVVRKADMNEEELGWIRDEIAIHKRLRHPHVCTLHGALESPTTLTIVLALCRGGSLCDTMGRALETNSPIPEARLHSTFLQLCGALHYCHRHGVVHRDLKLDNLCWADQRERVRDAQEEISQPTLVTRRLRLPAHCRSLGQRG